MRTALKRLLLVVVVVVVGSACVTSSSLLEIDVRTVWIPMPDGIRLAADLYVPAGAKNEKRPVLLEYLPYRKDESRSRNTSLYAYFLERGYIVARVDIRGTGNSEGKTIPYEYSDIELDDGEVVIEWLSSQAWSSGNIGMFGISWGGFNSIQMALRNPPALKAFVAVMATEALYQEDVHYIDGIMHTDSWMMSNDLYNALPGAPDFILDDEWVENRFDVEPSVYTYMREQRDGPFWDRASALNRYDEIRIPGYHIGGWFDGYRNSLPRMLENVSAPTKAMIGPWDHYFPHSAWPEPQVEWRHEAARWFDHWLKDIDTGILDEPDFAVYLREYYPPNPALTTVPGHWHWESGWPIERSQQQDWILQADNSLSLQPSKPASHELTYKPSMGLEGGGPTMWWGSVTPDQQPMDDDSLVYDSAPLSEALEMLGRPVAKLLVAADATRANWVVRISDVAPDGQVTQVAGAAFNGTHRNSAREPQDIVPGEPFALEIELHFSSWVFAKGHRIRVAISNAQWPMLWPTPQPMSSSLFVGAEALSMLSLPILATHSERVPTFVLPQPDPVLPGFETIDAGNISGYAAITSIQRDANTGEAFGIAENSGATRYPWGIERFEESIEHRTSDDNPSKTSVVGRYALIEELRDRTLRFEQEVSFSSDDRSFRLIFDRRVLEDGKLIREKRWDETIPRDYQ